MCELGVRNAYEVKDRRSTGTCLSPQTEFSGQSSHLGLRCLGGGQELLQLRVHGVLMLQSQLLLKLRHTCIRAASMQI